MNFNYPIPYVKLYDTTTTSAVASVVINNFDFTNYKFYRIYGFNIRPTSNNVGSLIRMSTDNGATFISAANTYVAAFDVIRSDNVASTPFGLGNAIQVSANASAAAANHDLNFFIDFAPTNNGNFNTIRISQATVVSPAAIGIFERNIGIGGLAAGNNVNALQFFFSAGNVNTGARFVIYGYPTL